MEALLSDFKLNEIYYLYKCYTDIYIKIIFLLNIFGIIFKPSLTILLDFIYLNYF